MTAAPLEALRQEVNQALAAHIARLPGGRLFDAIAYALLGAGKRLRPLLCIAACIDSGGARENALAPACGVEMIHCYSLAHDDLPCMDDDDERRGRPSLHKAFDEATALLAGDALQSLAFQTLAECAGVSAERRAQMLRELAEASGASGMAAGQMLDLQSEQSVSQSLESLKDTRQGSIGSDTKRLELLKDTQTKKTGALFRCALRLGLLSAGRSFDQLDSFADSFGLAFQAADDLRDHIGTREILGKPPGSDLRGEKLTWVSLMGIQGTHTALEELRKTCTSALSQVDFEPTLLAQVTQTALGTGDLVGIK